MEITEPAPMIPVAEPVTVVATSKYSRGKIYAIRSPHTDLYYTGSTCETLSKRVSCHRMSRKRYQAGKAGFCTSFTILEFGDAYIELIENFPCGSRDELHKREGEIQRERRADLVNKNVAGRTRAEHYEDHKTELIEKSNAYNASNKDAIKRKQDEIITCSTCSYESSRSNMRYHKKTRHPSPVTI